MPELQTRCFVGEIVEDHEVTVMLTEWVYEDGTSDEPTEIEYELEDRIVSDDYLAERFGRGRVTAITQDAVQQGR